MTSTPTKTTESIAGTVTTSYGYDHTGQRVWKDNGTTKTYYPFSNYEITDTGTTTKHIYAGDMLVATIEGSGAGALTYFNHLDHLNSTRVVTNGIGQTTQVLDYYPFGETRVDEQYGEQNQTKRYTGYDFDEETNLSYAGARYQSGMEGRFISIDPVSLALGNIGAQSLMTEKSFESYLRDPQGHNTYSYTRNNPILFVDKNGEWFKEFATGQQSYTDFKTEVGVATKYMTDNSKAWDYAVSNPKKAGLAVGVTGAAAAVPAAAGVAGVATIEAGVGAGYVGKMAVGSSLYGYVAKNSLDSIPDMVTSYSQFSTQDMSTWGSPVMNIGLMYGPNAMGEHVSAIYDIVDSIINLAKDLGIRREKDNDNDD